MRVFRLLVLCLLAVSFCGLAEAATPLAQINTAVIVIGAPELWDGYYADSFQRGLQSKYPTLVLGEEPRSKWLAYWQGKGLAAEPADIPREDFFAFAQSSSYPRVLYFVVQKVSFSETAGLRGTTGCHIDARILVVEPGAGEFSADKIITQTESGGAFGKSDASRQTAEKNEVLLVLIDFAKSK